MLLCLCSTLHFYNLKSSLTQPQMLVVTELDDPFVPLPDDLLVNLRESRAVIDTLLDSLPNTFASNSLVESATGPALQVRSSDVTYAIFMAHRHVFQYLRGGLEVHGPGSWGPALDGRHFIVGAVLMDGVLHTYWTESQ